MKSHFSALCLLVTFFGCGSSTLEEAFDDLAYGKDDAFSKKVVPVGRLLPGQTSEVVKYTASPRYREFQIEGRAGDLLDVWILSSDGNAIAWVTDSKYAILGKNNDANRSTRDAHIVLTLTKTDSYHVIFREVNFRDASFVVTLASTEPSHCAGFRTCEDQEADCGSIDDGCGGILTCGSCEAGDTCGGAGVANRCGRRNEEPVGQPTSIFADGTCYLPYPLASNGGNFSSSFSGNNQGDKGSCGGEGVGRVHHFVPKRSGKATVRLKASFWPAALYVRKSGCRGTELMCEQQWGQWPTLTTSIDAIAGVDYYIWVKHGSYQGPLYLDYTLSIDAP